MASMYQKKSCAALISAAVVFGLMIGCLATPWFYYDVTFVQKSANIPTTTLNSTSVTYDLFGIRTYTLDGIANHTQACTRYQKETLAPIDTYESVQTFAISSPSLSSVFKLSMAFVIISSISSIALCVVSALFLLESIRSATIRVLGLTFARAILHIPSIVLAISVSISFFSFLGICAAFKKDQAGCDRGPCQSFSGSTSFQNSDGTITSDSSWGPQAGWFMALAAAPTSLLALFFVASNRLPLHPHAEAECDEHDMQPMVEPSGVSTSVTGISHLHLPLHHRARSALLIAAALIALAIAAIIWACHRPLCSTCTAASATQPTPTVLDDLGMLESIEMQVLPLPPVKWPSLKDGRKFYEQFLSLLAAEARKGTGVLDFDFDPKAHKERSVMRHIWQATPSCESNCSKIVPLPIALVRFRQVVSGNGNGSMDFTLKQTRRFRPSAAALPQCTTATEDTPCKAKIEANYYWKSADSSDMGITWQRSCTLLLDSMFQPPVIRSVLDVQPLFLSASAAFGGPDAVLYERVDCYHEREYKVSRKPQYRHL